MLVNNFDILDSPDFIALDKDGQIILMAEVQGYPNSFREEKNKKYAMLHFLDYLQLVKENIPFAMLVDLENILIYKWNGKNFSDLILTLNSVYVLSHYEQDFTSKNIYKRYLTGLTESWLRDLAYHWKLQEPPAEKEIADIGLLKLLECGTTRYPTLSDFCGTTLR